MPNGFLALFILDLVLSCPVLEIDLVFLICTLKLHLLKLLDFYWCWTFNCSFWYWRTLLVLQYSISELWVGLSLAQLRHVAKVVFSFIFHRLSYNFRGQIKWYTSLRPILTYYIHCGSNLTKSLFKFCLFCGPILFVLFHCFDQLKFRFSVDQI